MSTATGIAPKQWRDLTTDELLELAKRTDKATPWHKYDRAMLIAFFTNRHGPNVRPEVYL